MKSPFKFIDSYTREDKELFFGREQEIEMLYTKVFQSKILLVYGASGTGKTSLIQCGLANKFQNSDWLPVFIRRGADINHSFKEKIREVSLSPLNEKIPIKKAIQSLYLDHFKPVFFIFDQFEELFIFGTKEEQTEFGIQLAEIVHSELNCRFIFSIREEYIAVLNYFEEFIPEFFDNRTRIEKITRKNAMEVIVGPCRVAGIKLDENFPEQLLEKLSPEGKVIELTYLQVYLDRMYRKTIENQKSKNIIFSSKLLDEMGRVGDVLSEFLDEQIELMKNPELTTAILKTFVSMEGTKRQVSLNEILETSKVLGKELEPVSTEETIHKLVDIRILSEKDEQGKYELRHDALAQRIFEKITLVEKELMEVKQFLENRYLEHLKRKTYLNQDDINYLQPYFNNIFVNNSVKLFYLDCKRKLIIKNKWKKISIIALVLTFFLLISSLSGLFYSLNLKKQIETIAHSNTSATKAYRTLEKDPTLAFRLAEQAYKISPQPLAKEVLMASYGEVPFYQVMRGYRESINLAKYSPNGKWIATASQDGLVKIWDSIGNFKITLKGHLGTFSAGNSDVVNFSPNSKLIISASLDSTTRLWEVSTGKCLAVMKHRRAVSSAVFSMDGTIILTASADKKARLWDMEGKELVIFRGHTKAVKLARFSPEGTKVLTASRDSTARLWELDGKEVVKFKEECSVDNANFSSDGKKIIISGFNKNVSIWNVSGKKMFSLDGFKDGQFSNFQDYIISRYQTNNIKLFDSSGAEIATLRGHTANLWQINFSPDGKNILTASDDGTARLWNLEGTELMVLKGHTDQILSANFSPDGNYVITASGDKTARIWNIRPKELPPSNYDSLLLEGIDISLDSVNKWLDKINKEKVRGEVMELRKEEMEIFGLGKTKSLWFSVSER